MSGVKTLNSIQIKHFMLFYVKANFKKIDGGSVKCPSFLACLQPVKLSKNCGAFFSGHPVAGSTISSGDFVMG